MWDYLSKIPPIYSFTIIILLIFAIVIIALWGKIRAKIGNKTIDLGGADSVANQDTIVLKKRSCGDCVLLIIAEREKFELHIRKELDHILKNQMVYAEQKLMEIYITFMNDMSSEIEKFKADNMVARPIQNKLLYGLLRDALFSIKDEIRRSFKDNGFHTRSGSDIMDYIKDQALIIISMLTNHLKSIYPEDRTDIISFEGILKIIDRNKVFVSEKISDMYINAVEVKNDTDKKMDSIKTQYAKWIDNFVS